MIAFDNYLTSPKSIPPLCRTWLTLMEIANFCYGRSADKPIYLACLENLPDGSMQHIKHVFGALIREQHTSIDNFVFLKKYPVHQHNSGQKTPTSATIKLIGVNYSISSKLAQS
jgi:hypothetical protein